MLQSASTPASLPPPRSRRPPTTPKLTLFLPWTGFLPPLTIWDLRMPGVVEKPRTGQKDQV